MSSNNRLLVTFNFYHIHLLLLLLAHVFINKIPTDPYGNYGCHLWLSPPCLCNWSGNQVFLSFHSKSLVPTPTIGDNQKWSPQADLLYVKSARCARLSPIQTEKIERMFIFKFFFITLTLFCSTVKLRKLKCTG